MKTTLSFVGMLSLAVGAFACGGGETEVKDPSTEAKPAETATQTPEAAATSTATTTTTEAKPAAPAPVVEDMKPSEDPKPLPSVKITAPKNDASVGDLAKAKDFEVKLDVKDWATVVNGPHVHLILDDHPYKPIYDTKKPVKIAELLPAGAELTEGEHTLVAFASRATHESVKGQGAQQLLTFWVGKKGKSTFDPKKPHVVYSRPKGENKGAMGKELLLDFYLFGTQLDKGEKVKYTVTSPALATPLTGEFTTWAPKVAKNLPKGDYEVTVELVDKDGKPLEGPLTKTTRKGVSVDAEAAAGDPHGGHGAAPAPAPTTAPAPATK
ncbi:hypothetical protein [Polyangium spumosum]|uniref:Uncharacterized protein n=1 Tax=Polyangium spumosum TaxID=889282 RepID=A0A6N7PUC2_9BACT|nr:hypothetical protein [Polyangium spumosum]MRG95832.1 hypothetical protein [Polyangium spumosum]